MDGLYTKRRKEKGVSYARSFVQDLLLIHKGKVARVAKILGCTRKCVYRARDGTLEDISRAPHTKHASHTPDASEKLVLEVREVTRYGRVRLSKHLNTKYGLSMPSGTIRHILRRHQVERHTYKRSSKETKPLYDYEQCYPFEHVQIDTKHIEDYEALGQLAFIPRQRGLPLYQWTAIDAKTKTKFLAYSYTLESAFGLRFMCMVALHIRSHGIITEINFQADNGLEFCLGSKRKEEEWNTFFQDHFHATFKSIPAGKKYLQGIVERTHRTDDEELYRPKLESMHTPKDFLYHAKRYQDVYNCHRPNFGRGMNGLTPLLKLKECYILGATHLLHDFPVCLMEDVMRVLSVSDVQAHYPNQLRSLLLF